MTQCDCSLKHTNKGVCNCLESTEILDAVDVTWEENLPEEDSENSSKTTIFKSIKDEFENWPSNIPL